MALGAKGGLRPQVHALMGGTALTLILAAAAPDVASAQQASAAPAAASPAPESKPRTAGDPTTAEVVVTATGTNIAGVKPVGSETVTLDREQMLSSGLTDIHQVLQTLPQVQSTPNAGGSGQTYREGGTTGYGGNATQGTAINIRGIGYGATLTLVDGRRVAPSGASNAFTEAIQVPIAAVQRVDVVTDGNSAIYGADAVSGVVNYVLRKDYEGVEISGRASTNKIYREAGASVTAGHRWRFDALGDGNAIVTFDYDHRSRGLRSRSPFLSQDLRPLGGVDTRAYNGAITPGGVGDLVVTNLDGSYSYFGLPSAAGPITAGMLGAANTVDSAQYSDYFPDLQRTQVAGFVNQQVTDWLSVYYEGFYTHRKTTTQQYAPNTGSTIQVCQGSPFYIPGIAQRPNRSVACPTGYETFSIPFFRYIGPTVTYNPDTAATHTVGLTAQLPARWKAEAYYTAGMDRTCGICNLGSNVTNEAFQYQVNQGNIKPFSTTPLTQAQLASFLGSNVQFARNTIQDAVAKFDGPLFDAPAGTVRAALGAEWSRQHETLSNGANRDANNSFRIDNVSDNTRTVKSAFAELYVPLLADLPMVKSLNLDAAVRYDEYSDFGGTTNPKVGLTWQVNDDLSFRGSWGKSFRAPTLTDKSPVVFSAELIGVPLANNSGNPAIVNGFFGNTLAIELIGNNPNLQPETAKTWSTGFDFQPHQIPGLKVSATYYRIDYSNQIISPNAADYLSSPANAALFTQYVTPIHNPATCVSGNPATYDPALADYLAHRISDYFAHIIGDYCSANVIIDARMHNQAATIQDGVDLQVLYGFDTSLGRWNLGATATKVLDNKIKTAATAPWTDKLDLLNYPVSLRGRGSLGWSQGPWSVNGFVNYTGSYTNTLPLNAGGVRGSTKIGSWTTFDLNVAYMVEETAGWRWARGVRVSVGVINLTDKDPPRALIQNGSNFAAFDASNADVLGRQVSVQLTKSF